MSLLCHLNLHFWAYEGGDYPERYRCECGAIGVRYEGPRVTRVERYPAEPLELGEIW